jgi:hypothetical protein
MEHDSTRAATGNKAAKRATNKRRTAHAQRRAGRNALIGSAGTGYKLNKAIFDHFFAAGANGTAMTAASRTKDTGASAIFEGFRASYQQLGAGTVNPQLVGQAAPSTVPKVHEDWLAKVLAIFWTHAAIMNMQTGAARTRAESDTERTA